MATNKKIQQQRPSYDDDENFEEESVDFTLMQSESKRRVNVITNIAGLNTSENNYFRYKKEDITKWLNAPWLYQNQLHNASRHFINTSGQYKRLTQYFSDLPVYSFLLLPYKTDISDIDENKVKEDYIYTANVIKNMNLRHEFSKIFDIIVTEDYFFGFVSETRDSFFITKLDPKYCRVEKIIDGNKVFKFDFSYFNSRKKEIGNINTFFINSYAKYKKDPAKFRWQLVPLSKSICIKFDDSINYAIPPFASVFNSLFELEDYKKLQKSKEATNNYKMITLQIPINERGQYQIDKRKITDTWDSYENSLPDNIGLAMSPLKAQEHNFERAGQASTNMVSEATEQFWQGSGVNSILFSSDKSGASVISASVSIDAGYIYAIYRQFERWLNYRLKTIKRTHKFQIKLLDVTCFNYKEMLESYMKILPFGAGMSPILSLLGYDFDDAVNLDFIEQNIFDFRSIFKPYTTSYTQSSDVKTGREKQDDDKIESKTEINRERIEENE